MFADSDWLNARSDLQAARLERWLSSVRRPVVVEIGAGTAIASVRRFSEEVICEHEGRLVRINPREANVATRWDVGLATSALRGLQAIDTALRMLAST